MTGDTYDWPKILAVRWRVVGITCRPMAAIATGTAIDGELREMSTEAQPA